MAFRVKLVLYDQVEAGREFQIVYAAVWNERNE